MRYLVVRIGAFGDCIIITPLLRYLKQEGHEVYVLTSESGKQMLANNPRIDKTLYHKKDSVANEDLEDYFKKVAKDNRCDKVIDLCESVEVTLALDAHDPKYSWTKVERSLVANKNYYEFAFKYGEVEVPIALPGNAKIRQDGKTRADFYVPEMFFTQEEEDFMKDFRKEHLGKKMILWGLSGSGRNKTYPYVPYVVADLLRADKNLVIVTVGEEACQILEAGIPNHPRVVKKSGIWTMRQSCLFTKYADLVISPDTGLLHASGCWETPKIGLLGHTTIENITKHFKNDHSLEAECACAPCFRLIFEAATQCPIDQEFNCCMCMSKDGIAPEKIYDTVLEVLNVGKEADIVSSVR